VAEKLTDCGAPGVRAKVAGVAVTPVGRPLVVTWMAPENPLSAVAKTETVWAAPPAVTVTVVPVTVSEKSGVATGACTVRVTGAVWVRLAAVPENCTVAVLAVAVAVAEKLTVCGVPGVRVKVAGVAVTPAGIPLAVTWIVPENPFRAAAETETVCAVPPAVTVMLVPVAVSEKSGFAVVPEVVPQPTVTCATATRDSKKNTSCH
jgi:hypothetical protein